MFKISSVSRLLRWKMCGSERDSKRHFYFWCENTDVEVKLGFRFYTGILILHIPLRAKGGIVALI